MIARKIAHFLFSLKYFNIVHVHKQTSFFISFRNQQESRPTASFPISVSEL